MMTRTAAVESAIRTELLRQNPCSFEALIERLPQFFWNEVFAVVDRLSRQGQLVLRHPAPSHYEVSIDAVRTSSIPACSDTAVSGNLTYALDEVGITH